MLVGNVYSKRIINEAKESGKLDFAGLELEKLPTVKSFRYLFVKYYFELL